jgi:4-hydroxybenzoate polyprenyltransferase
VSLRGLGWAGAVAIAAEFALAASAGPVLLAWTLAMLVYTWLMLKEFFVGEWLKQRLVLYGISHMFIISMMSMTAYAALLALMPGTLHRLWHPSLVLFAMMNFCFVYSLEVARKIRTPEQERAQVDTYSRRMGINGALMTVVGAQTLALTLLGIAARDLRVNSIAYALGCAALALVAAHFWKFSRNPTPEVARKLDAAAALTYLVLNVSLIVTWAWWR